jgi:hypothetical protein
MRKKRHLKYTPCKCPVWRFPHKPEDACYERLSEFEYDPVRDARREAEYADANGGGRAENFDQRIDSKTYYRNR